MPDLTPESVPAEWLRAAWDADYAWLRSPDRERGGSWGAVPERQLRRVLAAAAPLIAAAERERIARAGLAEADRGAKTGLDRIALRAFAQNLLEATDG